MGADLANGQAGNSLSIKDRLGGRDYSVSAHVYNVHLNVYVVHIGLAAAFSTVASGVFLGGIEAWAAPSAGKRSVDGGGQVHVSPSALRIFAAQLFDQCAMVR